MHFNLEDEIIEFYQTSNSKFYTQLQVFAAEIFQWFVGKDQPKAKCWHNDNIFYHASKELQDYFEFKNLVENESGKFIIYNNTLYLQYENTEKETFTAKPVINLGKIIGLLYLVGDDDCNYGNFGFIEKEDCFFAIKIDLENAFKFQLMDDPEETLVKKVENFYKQPIKNNADLELGETLKLLPSENLKVKDFENLTSREFKSFIYNLTQVKFDLFKDLMDKNIDDEFNIQKNILIKHLEVRFNMMVNIAKEQILTKPKVTIIKSLGKRNKTCNPSTPLSDQAESPVTPDNQKKLKPNNLL